MSSTRKAVNQAPSAKSLTRRLHTEIQRSLPCLIVTVDDLKAKSEGSYKLAAGAVVGALPVLLERTSSLRDPRTARQTRMVARTVALVVKVGHLGSERR